MKHSYNPECDCKRCIAEAQRRENVRIENQMHAQMTGRTRHRFPRVASPAEQHARYIDCGPAAWDDRD